MNCRECAYFTRKTKSGKNGIDFYHFCEYSGFIINDPDIEYCKKKNGKSHFSGKCKSCEYYMEDRKVCANDSVLCTYEGKTFNTDETKNSEGYSDPTAYQAIQNIENIEDKKFRRLIRGIFNLCDLAGFEIQGRIVFKSRKTGRVWK